jgi:parallel beta-helix repeat protein
VARGLVAAAALLALGGCEQDRAGLGCDGAERCVELEPSADGDDYVQIATALIEAREGDVIYLHQGTYHVRLGMTLSVDGVTVRGDGMNDTVISFAGQLDGAQGLLVTADDFTIEDLAVEDTAGDGVKVEGGDGVVFRDLRVEWIGGADSGNGAYGVYPVQCSNVLVEGSLVRGASDAGIYVGQSEKIVVRDNRVDHNVAGIEIENSFDADVHDNVATGNTGGVLVFNLPGLQVENGARTRVFDNEIIANNEPNFAPAGNIVGLVPAGTGFAAIAAHEIEIFDNTFEDNQTINTGIISYYLAMRDWDDESYVPTSDTIDIHDNSYSGGGDRPTGDLGFVLLAALGDEGVPDIVWDGVADPDKMDGDQLKDEYAICARDNGDGGVADLDAENEFADVELDAAMFDCAHAPLPTVRLSWE